MCGEEEDEDVAAESEAKLSPCNLDRRSGEKARWFSGSAEVEMVQRQWGWQNGRSSSSTAQVWLGARVINPKRTHTVELVNGKLSSILTRIDPDPPFGSSKLKVNGLSRRATRSVAVVRNNSVGTWTKSMTEGPGVGTSQTVLV